MSERGFRRGLFVLMVAVVVLMSVMYVLPEPAKGQSPPAISYASPSDGATFVDVIPGEGVNWTVNVTDSDGDLQRVRLLSNSSGSWQVFYDSGSLGGVSYHNASGVNPNWTGSWKTYYWRVACYDGTWTNYTYSFTTEYVFGQPHCIAINDIHNLETSVLYKNSTDYYLWFVDDNDDKIYVKISSNVDFGIKESINTGIGGTYLYNAFTYNNIPYCYYSTDSHCRPKYLWYNQTWQTADTDISTVGMGGYSGRSFGADVKYYNGHYQLVAGTICYASSSHSTYALVHYTSNNPLNGFTYMLTIEGGSCHYTPRSWPIPSLNILDGKLILTYIDNGKDLHWKVYDGVTWTDKGDIEADLGSGWELGGHWQSTLKDPVNHQLVCVYVNSSGWLVYRVLKNISEGWSDAHVIYKPGEGESIGYPHADYIDRRVVITFASNRRGNYNIYMITAPSYAEPISGIDITYNRIQFPDAVPNQQHVNSTIFAIKNTNDRPILNITWHVGKIGDIETANNARVWSNMSGTWQSWLVGSDHNTTTIDISAYKGSEWLPGEILYWKIEILDVGDVPEDLHSGDNNVWCKLDLG